MTLIHLDIKIINRALLYILTFSIAIERAFPFIDGLSYPKLVAVVYLSTLLINPNYTALLSRVNKLVILLVMLFLITNIFNGGLLDLSNIKAIDTSFFLNILLLWVLLTHEKLDSGVLQSSLFFFLIGYLALVVVYNLGYYERLLNGRVYIGSSLPNNLAFNGVVALAILLIFLNKINRSSFLLKFPIFVSAFLIITLVLDTGSRSALISLLLTLFIYFFYSKTSIRLILLLLSTIIISVFYESFSVISERVVSTLEVGEIGGRMPIITFILDQISSNLMFGVGRNQYDLLADIEFGYSPSPHNIFLEVFVYGGVFAFLLLIFIVIKIIMSAYKSTNSYTCFILLPAIMMQALTGQGFNNKLIFLVLAVIISSHTVNILRVESSRVSHPKNIR